MRILKGSFAAFTALLTPWAAASMSYTLEVDPSSRSLKVELEIDNPSETETLRIPAWCPGYYTILNYQEKLSEIQARDSSGKPLNIEHPDSRSWVIRRGTGSVKLSYRVLGDDEALGFFGVNVQSDTAYVSGPAAYLYADAHRLEEHRLRLTLPKGWDSAGGPTTLRDGLRVAKGYDQFADHPVQLGRMRKVPFKVSGIPFEAVFVVPPDQSIQCNPAVLGEQLRRISAPAIRMFGSAGFSRYTYIFHLDPGGFQGGLEHQASTVIALPNSADLGLAELAAHEYFHAWNVKQIRPVNLGPFDYSKEARTGNLWFAEGVTDYYAKRTTYASGLKNLDWFLEELSAQINQYQAGRTRLTKTVEDSSRAAWENGGFNLGDLDYYNKGLLIGLILDARIRSSTDGAKSLDDVMRVLYARHHLENTAGPETPGYTEDQLKATINEVAQSDLSELYDRMVRSTQELPYEILEQIGLKVMRSGAQLASYSTDQVTFPGVRRFSWRLAIIPQVSAKVQALREAYLRRP